MRNSEVTNTEVAKVAGGHEEIAKTSKSLSWLSLFDLHRANPLPMPQDRHDQNKKAGFLHGAACVIGLTRIFC